MPQRPWIEWDRWWTPLGGQIHVEEGGGFLRDPAGEFGRFLSLNTFSLDELLDRHCLILCGEPGMGKSTELDELNKRLPKLESEGDNIRADFRSCLDASDFRDKTLNSVQWTQWKCSDRKLRIIIDGVDEGLWLIPTFLEWFIEALKDHLPLDRLSIILACRTLEWPQALGKQLASLWSNGVPSYDVTSSPGWLKADDQQRDRIRNIARMFLLSRTSETPRSPNQSTNFCEAAFSAAWLLRNEWTNPGSLRDTVGKHCVPAIVWSFCGNDSAVAELTALIYAINPLRCREVFLEKLEFDANRDSGLTLAPQPFFNCWDSELSKITQEFLLTKVRRPETIRSVLQELARVDVSAALGTWRGLVKQHIKKDKGSIARTSAATELVLHIFPADTWNHLYPFLRSNHDIIRMATLRSAHYGHLDGFESQNQLTEEQLAQLYLLLYRVFPPSDPEERWPEDGEPHRLQPRHDAARFRDNLVDRLVARGTTAACNQLTRVTSRIAKSDRLWMKKRWLDCMELVRRKRWNPPGTNDVIELARRRNSFWIEDEADLLLAVVESLDEFQSSLHSSPSGDVLEMWTYKRKGARLTEFQPKSEVDVARKVYSWLRSKLGGAHGAIVHREVTVQWDQRRTDIDVIVAADNRRRQREIALTIEVKRAWNPRIRLDAREQLRDRYLIRTGKTHGLYLVAWFECSAWKPSRRKLKARSVDAARREIASICQKAQSAETTICSYVLDCGLPT